MTTRFYTHYVNTGDDISAPVVPSSWSVGWTKTATNYLQRASTFAWGIGTASGTALALNGANPSTTAFFRCVVIRPLAAQTISGNVKGQMLWQEVAGTDNLTNAFAIKVIQPSGADRGVLLAVSASDDTSATPPELTVTTPTNRKFRDASENVSIALSSLAVSDGDYLVFEYGVRQASTSTATGQGGKFGGTFTGTDLTEDDTDTAGNDWIEFDSNLTFLDSTASIVYYGSTATPEDSSAATGIADPTAVTPPAGMLAGDLVCMVGQERDATTTLTISEAGGQSWTTEAEISTTNQSANLFWCTFNGTWSANPSVDFASGTAVNTVVMHVFRPPTTAYTWSVNQAQVELDDTTDPFTITGQTTTGTDPTVTLAGWCTADDNEWGTLTWTGDAWGVCGTAQYRNTSGTDQSSSYAYKVQTSAGATGNVSKSQTTLGPNDTTTFIITFAATAPAGPPNVNDLVTVTESVGMNMLLFPGVDDTTTVSEAVNMNLVNNITLFDDVTLTDAVTMNLLVMPSVFDTVTVTEDAVALLPFLVPEVNDTVTVTESLTMNVILGPSVSDDVTVTDVPAMNVILGPSVSDDVTITESVAGYILLTPSVFDGVTVTEDLTVSLTSTNQVVIDVFDSVVVTDDGVQVHLLVMPSVADNVTVTESVTALLPILVPEVSDAVTVSESPVMNLLVMPTVNDAVTVTESSTALLPFLVPAVDDTVTITEQAVENLLVMPNTFDAVTVTESTSVVLPFLVPSVDDSVTVTDEPAMNMLVMPSVSDTVTVTENVAFNMLLLPAVSDDVTVTESATALLPFLLTSVSDDVSVTEQIAANLLVMPYVSDDVTVTESATAILPFLVMTASDDVTVTEQAIENLLLMPQTFDAVTVSEGVTAFLPFLVPAVADDVTVTESASVFLPFLVPSVFDEISVSEDIQVTLATEGTIPISVYDSVSVADDGVAVYLLLSMSVSDEISVSEQVVQHLLVMPSVNDDVTISEYVSGYILLTPAVFDAVSVAEHVTVSSGGAVAEITINAFDSVSIADDGVAVNLLLMPAVADDVTVSEQVDGNLRIAFSTFDGQVFLREENTDAVVRLADMETTVRIEDSDRTIRQ